MIQHKSLFWLPLFYLSVQIVLGQDTLVVGEQRITPVGERAHPASPIRAAVRAGGSDFVFVVDTGATANYFDEQLRSLCATPLGKRDLDSGHTQVAISAFETADICIGNRNIQLRAVGVLDLVELSATFGGDIRGVLGNSLLATTALGYQEVDESFYIGAAHYRHFDSKFPIQLEAGYIWTHDLEIGIPLGGFLIDTGMNSALSLSEKHFDEAKAAGLLYGVTNSQLGTVTGPYRSRTAFLKRITAWSHTFRDVPVVESSQEKVGLDLLRRFDFRINYQMRTIEISENKKTGQPFHRNRSGISLRSVGQRLVVADVVEGSPGHRAGVCAQDTVVALNGKPVDATWIGLCEVRTALSAPETTEASLTITRNESGDQAYAFRLLLSQVEN